MGARAWLTTETVLLLLTGSFWSLLTFPVFTKVPALFILATTVIVAVCEVPRDPNTQVIVAVMTQFPLDAEMELKVVPLGKVLMKVAPLASLDPLFVTVYV